MKTIQKNYVLFFGIALMVMVLSIGNIFAQEQSISDESSSNSSSQAGSVSKRPIKSVQPSETQDDELSLQRAKALKKAIDRYSASSSLKLKGTSLTGSARGNNLKNSLAEIRIRSMTRTPMQIKGDILERAAEGFMPGSERDHKTARSFLSSRRSLLGIDDPDSELKLHHAQTDHLNRRHLRFTQRYRNLPVWPADLIVHLTPDGDVDMMDGAYVSTPRKMTTRPAINADKALALARSETPEGETAEASAPELIVFAPGDRTPRLSWKTELRVSLSSRWIVVIDAMNGVKLAAFNRVPSENVAGTGVDLLGTPRSLNVWKQGNTYYMEDTSKQMYDASSKPPKPESTRGAIIVLDAEHQPPTSDVQEIPDVNYATSSRSDSGWLADAVSAEFNLSETYNYFLERHQRNSIDGNGGSLHAIVRIGRNFDNAAWVDELKTMIFGDKQPFAGALDVVGHELTHGVTSQTANMVYQDQPGALNEAFSDIFGEMVEARTIGKPDWLLGTNLSHPVRSMSNPSSIFVQAGMRYPSKMSEYINTKSDNGGVHINSTIVSHAYYLLAEGLTGAIGIKDAERIFYRALVFHLVQNSRFIDARFACIASAEELFGKDSLQAQKTAESFDAVEITGGGAPTPTDPTSITPINAEDSVLFVYYDLKAGGYLLNRHEPGDPEQGKSLALDYIARTRPSISGDGTMAVFVNSNNDTCFVSTDGSSPEDCMNWDNTSSVAMSRDNNFFGFVFLDDTTREPTNSIWVFDLRNNKPTSDSVRKINLVSPAIDGVSANTIERADAMMFTSDNRYIFYDALNQFKLRDGSLIGAWSIYAFDLQTGQTLVIMPPVSGFDIGFPSLSQTNNNFIAFDTMETATGNTTVYALNLIKGDKMPIAAVSGDWATPCYAGDDTAIIYSKKNASVSTGFSLMRQAIAKDYISPVGSPTVLLKNGDFAAIYRRAVTSGSSSTSSSGSSGGSSSSSSSGGGGGGGCFISASEPPVSLTIIILLLTSAIIGLIACLKKRN